MRAKVFQIIWHGKEPVYSLDFHPDGLLATAGADKGIKLWHVGRDEDGAPTVQHRTSLTGAHLRTVNCIRFSPTGEHLASGGDGGELFLWKANTAQIGGDETHWSRSILRSHTDDVQDVAWAPDGSALASASVENSTVLWDAAAAKGLLRLEGHRHYVQGCAWDPAAQFLATQSADRSCRIYGPKPPMAGKKGKAAAAAGSCAAGIKDFMCQNVLAKGQPVALPGSPKDEAGKVQRQPLFADENVNTFFRRLAWSPDGSFLAVPTGIHKAGTSAGTIKATHIYARGQWEMPIAHLPALQMPTVAVAFCPALFALRPGVPGDASAPAADGAPGDAAAAADGGAQGLVQLPYRMVFAVATFDSVFLYDTQGMRPVAVLGGLHMAPITDMAWSCDGATLAVSSRDGYCSLTAFAPGELGQPADEAVVPPHIARRLLSASKRVEPRPPPQPKQLSKAQPATPGNVAAASPSQQPQCSPSAAPQAVAQTPPAAAAGQQPATKQQRRIAPVPVASGAALRTLGQPAEQQQPQVSSAARTALQVPAGTSSEPPAQRRITPQAVDVPQQPARTVGVGTAAGAAGNAAGAGLKRQASAAHSGGEAAAAKQPRRLTPTQIRRTISAMSASFCSGTRPATTEGEVEQVAPPAVDGMVSKPAASGQQAPVAVPKRRITPMTVTAQSAAKDFCVLE